MLNRQKAILALLEAVNGPVSPTRFAKLMFLARHETGLQRCLILGTMTGKLPLHVVCDHSEPDFLWIVTVYIPQDSDWVAGKTRR